MLLKCTVIAILFGSMLTTLSAPAQEPSACRTDPCFEAAVPSARFVPNLAEASPADWAAYEDYEFIQRLNGLTRALIDFTAAYKTGQVDLKKVKALRKSLQELEKSEWFRPEKAK